MNSKVSSIVGCVSLLAIFASVTAALEAASAFVPIMEAASPALNNPYFAFNNWVNHILFPSKILESTDSMFGAEWGYYAICYIRDLFAATFLYYTTAGIWHIYIYNIKGDQFFVQQGYPMPSTEIIREQIMVAQMSIFCYAALPVFSEWLIEHNYTLVYWSISEIGGWPQYLIFTAIYLSLVEIGIYWMHRTLHTNKFLYKYVHGLHHKYNKRQLLTPWASIAFNPLDGILQASPYVVALFLVPCHYLTHVAMLFFTAIWATNIHDALDGNTEPIMGSKYHTIHHTHYMVNYGQIFIFCDWYWGTLRESTKRKKKC
uniref:Fatty acid hydroxylase domain-containing protein n=1 Tax=Octactis speculum TaxID=3111310 RepID=A0A7S2GVH5_9STRA